MNNPPLRTEQREEGATYSAYYTVHSRGIAAASTSDGYQVRVEERRRRRRYMCVNNTDDKEGGGGDEWIAEEAAEGENQRPFSAKKQKKTLSSPFFLFPPRSLLCAILFYK